MERYTIVPQPTSKVAAKRKIDLEKLNSLTASQRLGPSGIVRQMRDSSRY